MKNTPKAAILMALALLSVSRIASAGGWTQPEGGAYIKVWDRRLAAK